MPKWLSAILLWIVVPVAFVLIGFYVVGPLIGGSQSSVKSTTKTNATGDLQVPSDPTTTVTKNQPGRSFREPEIDISSKPKSNKSERRYRRQRDEEPADNQTKKGNQGDEEPHPFRGSPDESAVPEPDTTKRAEKTKGDDTGTKGNETAPGGDEASVGGTKPESPPTNSGGA